MAEVGSIVINGRMNTAEISKGSQKIRDEVRAISAQVESGQRSMKAFYQTQARAADRGGMENRIRDEMATRIKAMREEALAGKIQAEVQNRLFGGSQAIAAAEESGGKAGHAVSQGFLHELSGSLGKRSSLGHIGELLVGGGAIAGLAIVSERLNEMSKKAEEFALALDGGSENTNQIAADLLRSIPIAGDLGDALSRVYGLLDGSTVATARILKDAQNLNAVGDAIERVRGAISDSNEKSANFRREMDRIVKLLGATPLKGGLLQLSFNEEDQISAIKDRHMGKDSDLAKTLAANDKLLHDPTLGPDGQPLGLRDQLGKMQIPDAHFTGDEFGGQFQDNQKEVADAVARKEEMLGRIRKIEDADRKAKQNAEINAGGDVLALEKAMWGKRAELIKNGAGEAYQAAADILNRALESEGKRLGEHAEEIKSIIESIQTPAERLAEITERVNGLVGHGLNGDQAAAYIAQQKERLMPDQAQGGEKILKGYWNENRLPAGRERRFTFDTPLDAVQNQGGRDGVIKDPESHKLLKTIGDNTAKLKNVGAIPIFSLDSN